MEGPSTGYLVFFIVVIVGVVLIAGIGFILLLVTIFRKRKNETPVNTNPAVIDIPRPPAKNLKICPTCQSTYTDESLKYCLSDGALLEPVGGASDETETVIRQST
jgi:hypothetical protein